MRWVLGGDEPWQSRMEEPKFGLRGTERGAGGAHWRRRSSRGKRSLESPWESDAPGESELEEKATYRGIRGGENGGFERRSLRWGPIGASRQVQRTFHVEHSEFALESLACLLCCQSRAAGTMQTAPRSDYWARGDVVNRFT